MPSLTKAFLFVLLLTSSGTDAFPSREPASLKIRAVAGETVPNSWIIRYRSEVGDKAIKASQAKTASLLRKRNVRTRAGSDGIEPRYFNVSGFFGTHVYGDEAAVHELAADPAVDYISPDGKLEPTTIQSNN